MAGTNGVAGERFDAYVSTVADRLSGRGYERRADGPDDYDATVFHRRTLSPTKFGLVDYFVVVGRFDALDVDRAEAFSEAAFRYGLANKSSVPRGLGGNLVVFPVVVGDGVPNPVLSWVREYGPRHWASFEVPAVVDLATRGHASLDGRPIWGWLYYEGFAEFVDECLAPQ